MKQNSNKKLIMSVEEEKRLQLSDKCWICKKLFTDEDKKVRDHDLNTGKHRGAAHLNYNINLKLTKKVTVIFHNLRDYDSNLIMQEICKFDVKVNVIPNGLEKYVTFTINKNLIFINSMQFINSGLEALVKNLTYNDFKYLSQEFNGEQLSLIKQKGVYPYEYMNSFERFSEDKLPDRCEFYSSLKDGRIYEKDGCISAKDYLHAVNVWNEFNIQPLDDYYDVYLKADELLLIDVLEKFINWSVK